MSDPESLSPKSDAEKPIMTCTHHATLTEVLKYKCLKINAKAQLIPSLSVLLYARMTVMLVDYACSILYIDFNNQKILAASVYRSLGTSTYMALRAPDLRNCQEE